MVRAFCDLKKEKKARRKNEIKTENKNTKT